MGMKLCFDVYELDMCPDVEGGWEENSRDLIGRLDLLIGDMNDLTDVTLLKALKKAEFVSVLGSKYHPLATRDRKVVYAEDLYSGGEWWEVGCVKGHCPKYGLALVA